MLCAPFSASLKLRTNLRINFRNPIDKRHNNVVIYIHQFRKIIQGDQSMFVRESKMMMDMMMCMMNVMCMMARAHIDEISA